MIKTVALRNFKTFVDSNVHLAPVSLVVGANAVGKSNLFDAFRFLKFVGEGRSIRDAIEGHTSFGPSGATVAGIRGGASELTHLGSNSSIFELESTIEVGEDVLLYTISVDVKRYRVVKEELRALSKKRHPGPYVFSTDPETGPLEQAPDSPGIAARFYKATRGINPRREFSPYESILSQFSGRQAESRVNDETAQLVRTELSSFQPLELRPEVLRQYSPLGRFELGEHGENFAAVVYGLIEQVGHNGGDGQETGELSANDRIRAIVSWLSELTPRPVTSISASLSPTSEVIFALKEEPFEKSITARSLSDGTLRFAALALALLGFSGRRTLVIEELENGINPTRLQLLLRMIEQTVSEHQDAQVIASTHSPTVLEFASSSTLEGSLVLGWDEEGLASRVERMGTLLKKAGDARLSDLQAEGWLQFAADK